MIVIFGGHSGTAHYISSIIVVSDNKAFVKAEKAKELIKYKQQ